MACQVATILRFAPIPHHQRKMLPGYRLELPASPKADLGHLGDTDRAAAPG
jgi:hypothetical protein